MLYLQKQGTEQKLTVHDTSSQNGVAERKNRTILERVRALLHASGLPKNLWGEAARHVVWLMNRTSTKAVDGKTPYEAIFGKKPNLRGLKEWGEKCWVRVEDGDKLGGRVCKGRWMGFDEQSKGSRVYWPDRMSVTVERNLYFDNMALSTSRLEGEDGQFDGFVQTKVDLPVPGSNLTPPVPPVVHPAPPDTADPPQGDPPTSK